MWLNPLSCSSAKSETVSIGWPIEFNGKQTTTKIHSLKTELDRIFFVLTTNVYLLPMKSFELVPF
jgi:hypothetical protein